MVDQTIGALTPEKASALILEEAVAFSRGIEGRLLPAPDLFESTHAVELLRFAARITETANCPGCGALASLESLRLCSECVEAFCPSCQRKHGMISTGGAA